MNPLNLLEAFAILIEDGIIESSKLGIRLKIVRGILHMRWSSDRPRKEWYNNSSAAIISKEMMLVNDWKQITE